MDRQAAKNSGDVVVRVQAARHGRKTLPVYPPMPKPAINLESLERIVAAQDFRQTAEAALEAYRAVSPGDHFSAICFDTAELKADAIFLDHGWLGGGDGFWIAPQRKLCEHPMVRLFLSARKSMAQVRSRIVSELIWRESAIYNEVDRPLGIADIATIFQPKSHNKVMILTCGRDERFSDRDLGPVHSFQRVLNALVPSCIGLPRAVTAAEGAEACGNGACRLTAREREVLHWLRQSKRNAEIAAILGISARTVGHHLENIYAKLGVETRMAAAISAVD